jgi:hypothetical protein
MCDWRPGRHDDKKTCHAFSGCCDQGHDGTADRSAANPKGSIMKTILTVVAMALSTLATGQALAADPGAAKSRAEVKAELADAIRSGNMIASGESGATFRELFPHRYAQPVVTAGKTRAEVKAELAEAIRNGDMVASGESGATFRELYPHQYTQQPVNAGKSRAEVKAELSDAMRNGNLNAEGKSGASFKRYYPGRDGQHS